MILKPILGSKNLERVLIFIAARGEGYAREIARFFETDLKPVQNQLEKLEQGGVIVRKKVGKTILFQFNPRYPFLKELVNLLDKALDYYPEDIREKLIYNRRRPRRKDKPFK